MTLYWMDSALQRACMCVYFVNVDVSRTDESPSNNTSDNGVFGNQIQVVMAANKKKKKMPCKDVLQQCKQRHKMGG